MTLDELQHLITIEERRLRAKYGQSADNEKWALAQAVKLTEELGELCAEILSTYAMQRKDHPVMDESGRDRLMDEFADVVITALIAAQTMDIDIQSALVKKLRKIRERSNRV